MTASSGGQPDQHQKGRLRRWQHCSPNPERGLEIELSGFEAENATLKGDYLWQVVEIVVGGVPTVLKVHFLCLVMSLGRILLQCSVSTNLFSPMRHQVDLQKVEVGI